MKFMRLPLIVIWTGFLLVAPQVCEAQAKLDKRLAQKVSVDFDKKPVDEALRELGDKNKLPVEIDPEASLDSAVITLTASGISLESALQIICDANHVVWAVEKGKLMVMTVEADEKSMVVREYPLAGLGGNIDPQLLAVNLVGMTSGMWIVVDQEGGDITAITPQSMTIRQSRKVHGEVQSLFDQMSAAAGGRAKAVTAQDRAEQLIVKKLQTPVQVAAGELDLTELLDQLLKKNGVPYWVDNVALSDEGIDLARLQSTVDAKKVPAAKRLDAIVAQHNLSWSVAAEVVQITTAAKANETMFVRVYDVSKLVAPNRPIPVVMGQLLGNKDLGEWQMTAGTGGGIMPFGTSLVIRQTGNAHAKIAKILK